MTLKNLPVEPFLTDRGLVLKRALYPSEAIPIITLLTKTKKEKKNNVFSSFKSGSSVD